MFVKALVADLVVQVVENARQEEHLPEFLLSQPWPPLQA
jgi:hypothetical protein